jgi:hypothetical protein
MPTGCRIQGSGDSLVARVSAVCDGKGIEGQQNAVSLSELKRKVRQFATRHILVKELFDSTPYTDRELKSALSVGRKPSYQHDSLSFLFRWLITVCPTSAALCSDSDDLDSEYVGFCLS